jgi:hypothetical protein
MSYVAISERRERKREREREREREGEREKRVRERENGEWHYGYTWVYNLQSEPGKGKSYGQRLKTIFRLLSLILYFEMRRHWGYGSRVVTGSS